MFFDHCYVNTSTCPAKVHQFIGATGVRYQLFGHAFVLPLSLWGEIEDTITDEVMVEVFSMHTFSI